MAEFCSDCKKRALVTGGSRGLGFHTALYLAKQGWDVSIAARSNENLENARKRAEEKGVELNTIQADVTDEQSVFNLFGTLKKRGSLHLCVNNAGTNYSKLLVRKKGDQISRYPLEEWNRIVQLCLTGTFLCGREAAALMIENETAGTIINITSAVRNGAFAQSAYTASKAGIVSLTKTWAVELADYGIRVAAVSPGVIEGEALKNKCAEHVGHAKYMEKLKENILLKRFATEEEIAKTIHFVAENDYMTNTVIEIEGGGVPERI